jgi:hypothetical protein
MRGFWSAVVLIAVPRTASAELPDLKLEGYYGKLGVQTGYAFSRERGSSPHVGVVGTFVHINEHLEWYGFQSDFTIDWNGDQKAGGRWSFGPEAGVAIYGVDLSYFGQRVDDGFQHGMQIRAKLTVGVAAIYLRTSHALVGADETSFDVGLQLKKPVFVRRKKRPWVVATR